MNQGDIIDILFGVGILILITCYLLYINRRRTLLSKRQENSIGEKYMQLMATFMRENRGRLVEMSENSAYLEVNNNDLEKENLSLIQNEKGVNILWTLTSASTKLNLEFEFFNNETQLEIMKVIEEGITEAKNKV